MKLFKKESKETSATSDAAAERRPRFQIVKLEERIAPYYCYTCRPHGHRGHHNYKP